jgi:DNA-binding MarR family transcriptional regulator
VIQVVAEMTERGLLKSTPDKQDGRRRQIALTAKGRKLASRLVPVWNAFAEAGQEITTERDNNFIASISKLEDAQRRESLGERIKSKLR